MNYVLIFVGTVLSFLSYRWPYYYMCNPNYYRLKGRSEATQLWFETISNLIFFGGYVLIILSSGFLLSRILINLGIVILLQFFVFPFLGTRRRYKVKENPNNLDAESDRQNSWNGMTFRPILTNKPSTKRYTINRSNLTLYYIKFFYNVVDAVCLYPNMPIEIQY